MQYTPIKLKVNENDETPDYNLRVHNRIISLGEAKLKRNPLPVFSTTANYKFEHEPKQTYRFIGESLLVNDWGDIPLYYFSRQGDNAGLTMTIYSQSPETGL